MVVIHTYYILHSNKLNKAEKENLDKYLYQDLTTSDIKGSISWLMEWLHKHFNKKVWVLIDEYDSAIHEADTTFGKDKKNPYQFSTEFDKVLKLFRKLLGSALKSENHLKKGVVTEILRIAKANLFSELNNFTEYNVLDEDFVPYYGFSAEEWKCCVINKTFQRISGWRLSNRIMGITMVA